MKYYSINLPVLLLFAMCFCCLSVPVRSAQADCIASDENCREIGRWEFAIALGLGGRTNPLVDGDNQPILLVPQFSWYGKYFFVDNFEVGFTLHESRTQMVNLLVQPGFDHIYFDDIGLGNFTLGDDFGRGTLSIENVTDVHNLGNGMTPNSSEDLPGTDNPDFTEQPGSDVRQELDDLETRGIAFLGGVEYSYFTEHWQLQLQLLNDVSGVHDGSEVRLSSAWDWLGGDNRFTLAAGVIWQSQELLDYYYGIDETEASNEIFVFEADEGISSFVKFSWQKKLNRKWSLLSTLQLRKLDSSLTRSPLVEESKVATVFIGGSYHF